MTVTKRAWEKADTSRAERVAALYGVADPPPPSGMVLVGWLWEHDDGSSGVVRPGENTCHRSQPVRMRCLYTRLLPDD